MEGTMLWFQQWVEPQLFMVEGEITRTISVMGRDSSPSWQKEHTPGTLQRATTSKDLADGGYPAPISQGQDLEPSWWETGLGHLPAESGVGH